MMFCEVREPQQRNAALIDADPSRREMFALMLGTRNLQVAARYASVDEALSVERLPELSLINTDRVSDAVLGDIARLRAGAETAILLLVAEAEADDIEAAVGAGADHVLPVGLQSDRFSVGAAGALGAFRQRQTQLKALSKAEHDLAAAKQIFRAKVILIARHGLNEQDAHRRIQKMSMERNVPLREMARLIVDAEDLLC